MKKKIIPFKNGAVLYCFLFINLYTCFSQEELSPLNVLTISDEELSEDDVGGSENITGFLQASKAVFLKTAAFNFGQARFKVRGYDSREGTILINGIKMNKIFDGRPQWSNWGGLNDVLRNQTYVNGFTASNFGFGSLLGVTNFNTSASQYRKGSRFSTASTNGNYKGRVMASYFSGEQKKGWFYAVSLSRRFAKKGYFEGTTYNAWSGFFALEKQLNKKQRLNLTAIFASNRRGKSSPNTQEVFDLKGTRYNSYWGFQNGEIRNSRIKEISEPILMLTHFWSPNKKTTIQSSLAYQFGHIGNSRLGYANVVNPDPAYYKKLPSYNLRFPEDLDHAGAYLSLKDFQNNGQIHWEELYKVNSISGEANYYVYEDRNDNKKVSFQSTIQKRIRENLKLVSGISFSRLKSLNYAKVLDVLGENGFLDKDPFEEGIASENNLNAIGRWVQNGDNFSYKYELEANVFHGFSQLELSSKRVETYVAFSIDRNTYQRNGLFKNGQYPESSFGKGIQKKFIGFGIKTGGLYKFSGRHLLHYNVAYISQIPNLRNTFSNVRLQHDFSPRLQNELKTNIDISYQYRAPIVKAKLTGYRTSFSNAMETSFTFAQGLKGDTSDFVGQVLTGIQKQHIGLELGIEAQITATTKLIGVAALGQFTYRNNPNLFLVTNEFSKENNNFGSVSLKNYKIGGTPQRAYSLGFEYRDPAYWWFGINANLLSHNYIQIAPLLRTHNFLLDSDGIPFRNSETENFISENDIRRLLKQERFKQTFLVNLVGGKSWKLNKKYLSLFMSVNNLLGAVYKTGGFEQARNANYQNLKEDRNRETPLFGSKYWYGKGTTYFLILSLRF